MESSKRDTLITDALTHLENKNPEKCFEFLANALASPRSTDQFNESFHAVLFALNTMIADNDWAGLTKIDVMYRSGIITDRSFIDFFTCIHELAMFHETDNKKHKKAYKSIWRNLAPSLQEIVFRLIEDDGGPEANDE